MSKKKIDKRACFHFPLADAARKQDESWNEINVGMFTIGKRDLLGTDLWPDDGHFVRKMYITGREIIIPLYLFYEVYV